ncbi:MAG: acetyl-CoA synthase subunit gamma [Desulfarculus sp.]|nr:MAG: acetyl-CoA synthase subunit gamma [Desulfarculus sp.]
MAQAQPRAVFRQPFVLGELPTPAGPVPRVGAALSAGDRLSALRVRWGIGRGDYRLAPGLYALGEPGPESPVLVSANYKLSFDHLRAALPGLDAWILVLDTDGVNVWCAAGKGRLGTEELVRRVQASGLASVVSHRRLILPQLAGPGVEAHRLKKLCGFQAVFGPVRAADLPAFIASGFRATPQMRRVSFPLAQRLILIPVELVGALQYYLWLLPALALLAGLGGLAHGAGFAAAAWQDGLWAVIAALLALAAGAVAAPALLPWLPGRAFSLKGLWPGLAAAALLWFWWPGPAWPPGPALTAWLLLVPALSSFLALNFTGASNYTSLSGVKKEMRRAVPVQIAAAALGLGLWLYAIFLA